MELDLTATDDPATRLSPPVIRVNGVAFAITVAFELVDGALADFHRLVSENAALSVEREPECLRFDVLTPSSGTPGPDILLYEIYRDKAAFDLHLASEHYRDFDRQTRDLIRKKTVVTFAVAENAKADPVRA